MCVYVCTRSPLQSVIVHVHIHTHSLHGVMATGVVFIVFSRMDSKSTLHNTFLFQNSDPSNPCTKHLYINLNYANANPRDIDVGRQGG